MTILLGSFSIMLLFALMAQLCMTQNMLKKPKDLFIKGLMTRLEMGVTNLSRFCLFDQNCCSTSTDISMKVNTVDRKMNAGERSSGTKSAIRLTEPVARLLSDIQN